MTALTIVLERPDWEMTSQHSPAVSIWQLNESHSIHKLDSHPQKAEPRSDNVTRANLVERHTCGGIATPSFGDDDGDDDDDDYDDDDDGVFL